LARIQKSIDETYHHFVSTVSQDRALLFDETDALAQGRIWSGADALKNGLIDNVGGLFDAIHYAAQSVALTHYQVVEYPSVNSIWERMMQSISTESQVSVWSADPQKWTDEIEKAIRQVSQRGIQAKIPFLYTFIF
jgi:protease-4